MERLSSKPSDVQVDPTLEAICELTGASRKRVLDLLQDVRRERREAKIAEALIELEEPLYRVERPATEVPHDAIYDLQFRKATTESLLDQAEELERRQQLARERKMALEPSGFDKWSTLILALFITLIITVAISGMVHTLRP